MSERSDREVHGSLVERMRSSEINKSTARRLADESLRRVEQRKEREQQQKR